MTYKHTEWLNVTYEIKYDYDDLKQLNEQLIQLPKIITSKELSNAKLSLDDTESILSSISSHRRIKNWKEAVIEVSTYIGYTAIIIIALYFTYRIGIFDMIKNCLPTKLCLLCIKTKVEAPTHVVTYNAAV